jgi:hypothetical protein
VAEVNPNSPAVAMDDTDRLPQPLSARLLADFREAPDDTPLEPGENLPPSHGGNHRAAVTAHTGRYPLGSDDETAVPVVVLEWVDDRPRATVGDMRTLIRQAGEQRG